MRPSCYTRALINQVVNKAYWKGCDIVYISYYNRIKKEDIAKIKCLKINATNIKLLGNLGLLGTYHKRHNKNY